MVVHKCDRCGKEMSKGSWLEIDVETGHETGIVNTYEFCDSCIKDIMAVMRGEDLPKPVVRSK